MIITLLLLVTTANALTKLRNQSPMYSRLVSTGFISTIMIVYSNVYINPLSKGIGVYGSLFNVNLYTQIFSVFILGIATIILTLTSLYPYIKLVKAKPFGLLQSLKSEQHYDISTPETDISKENNNVYLIDNTFSVLSGKQLEKPQNNSVILIQDKESSTFNIIEYALVITFVLCGALFLISVSDLISMFLSIELQSYGLYIICTLHRNSESSTSSGLTYFLLGSLSSCFILLGSAIIYANTGATNLDSLYVITSISGSQNIHDIYTGYEPYYLYLSFIIIVVGFLFKVSAAPFHFWSPDVYDGIPTIVTTFVAVIPKISIFAFLLELVYYTEYTFTGGLISFSWKGVLIISSLLSLVIGSVLGLTQYRIKRLFAYSTISHVGFILLALSINSAESIESFVFYLLQYTISNLNAFIIVLAIGYIYLTELVHEKHGKINNIYEGNVKSEDKVGSTYNALDKDYSPVQLINQLKGFFYINPFISFSLAITLFSFVGIPPLMGFFAKQMVLNAALDNGYIFMTLIAIFTSVIGAGYYLNLIKQMFFYEKGNIHYLGMDTNYYIDNILIFYNNEDKSINLSNNNINNNKNIVDSNTTSNKYKLTGERHMENYYAEKIRYGSLYIRFNSLLPTNISVLTLLLLLFIYIPGEWFNIVNIITITLFKS